VKRTVLLLTVLTLTATACNVFKNPPGRPSAGSQELPPGEIKDFSVLYGKNCAGCHGEDGRGGAAIGLGDPLYLAIADDATIRRVTADGVPGTAMAAFAQTSGGLLSKKQIDAIVTGMRTSWGKGTNPDSLNPPPYRAQAAGDAKRGATVYATYCSSCHGADGRGGKASSIVDGSFLALVSDQGLRTTVIVGRPDLGAPDWRNNVPNKPMSPEDVSDVVAWLVAQRLQFPGQPYTSAKLTRSASAIARSLNREAQAR
jgi:mono/diheme cytochrome c family protein